MTQRQKIEDSECLNYSFLKVGVRRRNAKAGGGGGMRKMGWLPVIEPIGGIICDPQPLHGM